LSLLVGAGGGRRGRGTKMFFWKNRNKKEIQKLSFEKSYVVKDASDDVEIKNR